MKPLSVDYFILSETKIDESFLTAQINVEGYEIRARLDRDKYDEGLIEFVRRGLICKRLRDHQPKHNESLYSELTLPTKSRYDLVSTGHQSQVIFQCFLKNRQYLSLSKAILKYENLLNMGDFNIEMKSENLGYDKINLTNLIKSETCFTKNHESLINTPWSFQNTHLSETALSNCHKLITAFLKTNFSRLRPKVLSYRNYKNFDESKFLNDLSKIIITFDNKNPNQDYNVLKNRFLEVVNVHASLKTKIVRGNDSPFVDKQFQKTIYTRTRFKNKIHKNPSKENKMAYKRQINFRVSLKRKRMKNSFKKLTEKGLTANKSFWKFMKPFLTNQGLIKNNDIPIHLFTYS